MTRSASFDRGGGGIDHLVGEAEFARCAAASARDRDVATIVCDEAERPRGARDRAADQADADQRETIE